MSVNSVLCMIQSQIIEIGTGKIYVLTGDMQGKYKEFENKNSVWTQYTYFDKYENVILQNIIHVIYLRLPPL